MTQESDNRSYSVLPYIPRSDTGKRDWFLYFAGKVAEDPEAYELTEQDALLLTTRAQAFSEALRLAMAPLTRTTTVVFGKNNARQGALDAFRPIAMFIKNNPAVSNQLKAELGLHRDDPKPTRVRVSRSQPVLNIVSSGNLQIALTFKDRSMPSRRAKPKGAQRLELFVAIRAGQPSGDREEARYLRSYTKAPITVYFDEKDGGRCATFYGRWATNTGEVGALSPGVSLTIPDAGCAAVIGAQQEMRLAA